MNFLKPVQLLFNTFPLNFFLLLPSCSLPVTLFGQEMSNEEIFVLNGQVCSY